MKVLLLNPEVKHMKELMRIRPPLGLAYLGSALEKAGHKVKVIDLNIEKKPRDALLKNLKEYDVVGVTILSVYYNSAIDLIKTIKLFDKNKIIIVGGVHASVLPDYVMKSKYIDFLIRYEGEETIVELMNALDNKKRFDKISGLSYKSDGKIIHNKERIPIRNIDNLEPARHLLKLKEYKGNIDGKQATTILTSRGCPYNCAYCCKSEGRIWRGKNPKKIIDEIESVYKAYNIKTFYFEDDLFTFDKERVINICKEILKRDLKIKWLCVSRVDCVDKELLTYMKKAGCIAIHYGVESGDQEVLNKIGKGITLKQVKDIFKLTHDVGILSKGYFIIGFPWDTKTTIKNTIDFSLSLDADQLQYSICVPFPGCRLWDIAIKEGIIDLNKINWDDFSLTNIELKDKVFFTNNLTEMEIKYLKRYAYRKAIIKTTLNNLKRGNLKRVYNIIKEKKESGLLKFLRELFVPHHLRLFYLN